MKTKKIEVNITYFILSLAIFLLNFNSFSPLAIILGSFLNFLIIKLNEKINFLNNKVSKFLIFLLSFLFLIIYLNKLTSFISFNMLRNYSTILISLALLISSYFLVIKGYHTIIKVILLSSYFLLFIFIIGLILTSFYLDFNNFNLGIFKSNNLVFETFYYTFLMFYLYSLLYLPSKAKFSFQDLMISNFLNLSFYFFVVGILSKTLVDIYKYPYLIIYKKINLINFIDRIEIIFAFNYLFCFYYLFLLMYYELKREIKTLKKNKVPRLVFLILSIFIFITSVLIF